MRNAFAAAYAAKRQLRAKKTAVPKPANVEPQPQEVQPTEASSASAAIMAVKAKRGIL